MNSDRDILRSFLESWKDFKQLSTLKLDWDFGIPNTNRLHYFDDNDLIYISKIPNLSLFELRSRQNNFTLPGILETIGKCAKLTHFSIIGFKQRFSADGKTMMDEDIYDKFRKVSRANKRKSLHMRITDNTHGKQYHIYPEFTNSFELFQRVL